MARSHGGFRPSRTELLALGDDRPCGEAKTRQSSSVDNVKCLLALTEVPPVARRAKADDTYPMHGFNEFHEPDVTKRVSRVVAPRLFVRFMTDQRNEFAMRFGSTLLVTKLSFVVLRKS